MTPLHIARASAVVWKWFCRFPDAIGLVYDIFSDEDFYTYPTTPLRDAEEHHGLNMSACTSILKCQTLTVHGSLSRSQNTRLRRRHLQVVRQLTTPPLVITPSPHSLLLAYQRPIRVYRPGWAFFVIFRTQDVRV
jgi:hypothetical protein